MKKPNGIWIRDVDNNIAFEEAEEIPWWAAVAGLLGLFTCGLMLGAVAYLIFSRF